ncbi:MAG: 3-deoxy-7-phosphoheptulonate synthase, partial [Gammaproteobacteria bacterium]|nr:3-deoxy-7-phosphoheptulonate synthase [Gammaproteobacteria bacterium]
RKQINVCKDICKQLSKGERRIFGVMIESNLVEGSQRITQPDTMLYGQSVTDACIGWEDSERCLRDLASASGEKIKQMMA